MPSDPSLHVDVIGTYSNVQLHAVEYPDNSIRFRFDADGPVELSHQETVRMQADVSEWVRRRTDDLLSDAIERGDAQ